jgi:hypothetical protein
MMFDQTIVSDGRAIAVILAGVIEIKDCKSRRNKALIGTGDAILVGGQQELSPT